MVESQSNRSATAQKAKCPASQSDPPVVSHHCPESTFSSELAHPVADDSAGHCSQTECQGKQNGQQDVPLVRNTLAPTCTGRHPLIKSAPLSQNGIQRGTLTSLLHCHFDTLCHDSTMQLDYPYHPPVIATFLSWPGMSRLLLWLVSLPHPGLQDKCPLTFQPTPNLSLLPPGTLGMGRVG